MLATVDTSSNLPCANYIDLSMLRNRCSAIWEVQSIMCNNRCHSDVLITQTHSSPSLTHTLTRSSSLRLRHTTSSL
eukprot:5853903-Pyramimonas_sp.AAC.1